MAWYAGNNSTNGGNNTGWIFTAPPTPVNYALNGNSGAYTYTGQSATLTYTAGAVTVAYSLLGEAGSYLLNGQSATLTYTNRAQIIWGGAGTYKGEFGPVDDEYNEEDDEEMIIMALAHQLIEMRVI